MCVTPGASTGHELERHLVGVFGGCVRHDEERPVEGKLTAPATRVLVGPAARDGRTDAVDARVEPVATGFRELEALTVPARLGAAPEPFVERPRRAIRADDEPVERHRVARDDDAHAFSSLPWPDGLKHADRATGRRCSSAADRRVADGQRIVIVNVWGALVSVPPSAVPPLSTARTVTVATPTARSPGV